MLEIITAIALAIAAALPGDLPEKWDIMEERGNFCELSWDERDCHDFGLRQR